ncbi:MAG: winged helix-turn-helix domain-containing protein [Muribaculaceae bacterium]|nr:winged helix-turn-helix domain-containing protein [Muribaculaceae bacterium]
MNVDTIGVNAGLLWNALNEADVLGIKQIKKITKLKDKEVYAAIGWLARENKITVQTDPKDEKELLITLVPEH